MDYRIETLSDIPVPVVGVKEHMQLDKKHKKIFLSFGWNLKQWVTKSLDITK